MMKIFNKYECSSNRKARKKLNKVIDEIIKGYKPNGNQLIYAKSPKLFKKIGIPDYEIIMSPNEIAKAILSKNKAEILKYPIGKNDDYHNLGKKVFNRVLDSMLDPLLIIKETNNKIVVFSQLKDYKNRRIIIPMAIEVQSYKERKRSIYNVILSIHGRQSIDKYINKLIKSNSKIIYINK